MVLNRPLNLIASRSMFALMLMWASSVHAAGAAKSDWRWGYSLGYGAQGVTSTQPLGGGTITATRAEGPLVTGIFIDKLLSDTLALSFEHTRGITFVPFSSGVSFTGLVNRWYFMGIAPSAVSIGDQAGATIFTQRYVPFFGLAYGFAQASIQRDSTEAVQVVAGSGAYLGIRVGVDTAKALGSGVRYELAYANSDFLSSFSSSAQPPTLTMFSLQAAWYFGF